jgi:hypothetical protein
MFRSDETAATVTMTAPIVGGMEYSDGPELDLRRCNRAVLHEPVPAGPRADHRRQPSLVPNVLNFRDFSNGYGGPDSRFESCSLRHELNI